MPLQNAERNMNFADRFKTFEKWPLAYVSPQSLAEAGYIYTGTGDEVKCVVCNVVHFNWMMGDKPMFEHRRSNPNCSYAAMVPDDELYVPAMKEYRERFATYADWPGWVTHRANDMARAGFFFMEAGEDRVRCFCCGHEVEYLVALAKEDGYHYTYLIKAVQQYKHRLQTFRELKDLINAAKRIKARITDMRLDEQSQLDKDLPRRVMEKRMQNQLQINKEPPEAHSVITLDALVAETLQRTDISEFEKAGQLSSILERFLALKQKAIPDENPLELSTDVTAQPPPIASEKQPTVSTPQTVSSLPARPVPRKRKHPEETDESTKSTKQPRQPLFPADLPTKGQKRDLESEPGDSNKPKAARVALFPPSLPKKGSKRRFQDESTELRPTKTARIALFPPTAPRKGRKRQPEEVENPTYPRKRPRRPLFPVTTPLRGKKRKAHQIEGSVKKLRSRTIQTGSGLPRIQWITLT
ncbi:uncharacterized protein LOC129589753 [Paramacrobiotus metropolitanus]|uniref:uncharacterized protein LOC129589753 n=1 Tax=Paramacrobiotus metropolitanus TaxID=2943436 RepID=UPI002445B331|nr:uncharacterized protein LOC129589753 [Paramacrobiotus metropolitanus]